MWLSLKGCKFDHIELSIHFESFKDEFSTVREAQDANLLRKESKLTRVNLYVTRVNLQLCVLKKSDHSVLKRILFQNLRVNFQPEFSLHYKLVRL